MKSEGNNYYVRHNKENERRVLKIMKWEPRGNRLKGEYM